MAGGGPVKTERGARQNQALASACALRATADCMDSAFQALWSESISALRRPSMCGGLRMLA